MGDTVISIHALFAEGDPAPDYSAEHTEVFLSTPSSQRATTRNRPYPISPGISIHALFAEGDHSLKRDNSRGPLISIHALFAEGDWRAAARRPAAAGFLSTPSSQRATAARP